MEEADEEYARIMVRSTLCRKLNSRRGIYAEAEKSPLHGELRTEIFGLGSWSNE